MSKRKPWKGWSDVEVVYDEAEAAASFGLEMVPGRHTIMADGEWIRWVRRTFDRPDLFVYFHEEHETFVLAEWIRRRDRGRPMCIELESMDWPPDTKPSQLGEDYLRARFRSSSDAVAEMRASIREMAYYKRLAKRQRGESRLEAVRQLRKRGLAMEAMCVEKGAVNMDFEEDEISETINGMLLEACRMPKVISTG